MRQTNALEAAYYRLLRAHGLGEKRSLGQKEIKQIFDNLIREQKNTSESEGLGFLLSKNLDLEKFEKEITDEILAQGVGFNNILQSFAIAIEDGFKNLGREVEQNIFVGEFPTGSFNAQACLVPEGILVLINTGLMMLIHQVVKVMMFDFKIGIIDDKRNVDNVFSHHFDRQQVIDAIAEIILAYLFYRRSTAATRFPMEGGARGMMVSSIVSSAERFAVAHEYGHSIAGHLSTTKKSIVANSPTGDLDLIPKNWKEEIEADFLATYALLASQDLVVDNEAKFFRMQLFMAGPLVFFAIDEIVNNVIAKITKIDASNFIQDHPPSSARRKGIRDQFIRASNESFLELPDAFVAWLLNIQDDVIKNIEVKLR